MTQKTEMIRDLVAATAAGRLDRRSFIAALGTIVALPAALKANLAVAATGELILVNWGGDAIDVYTNAWAKALADRTGLTLKVDGSGPAEGTIRAQVESGAVSWDVVDADIFSAFTLGREGALLAVDPAKVDATKGGEGNVTEFGVTPYLFSHVIAYDKTAFGGAVPTTWADFFDVEKFPGKRTAYKWMVGVLEAALMADGVAPDAVYPVDVDRALARIEAIKPHMAAWWESGGQSQQLFLDGEVTMGLIWNTRASSLARDTDGKIDFTFNQGILQPGNFSAVKGGPAGPDAAFALMDASLEPEGQLAIFDAMGFAPANPAAAALVPADQQRFNAGSPEALAVQVRMDVDWYSKNYGRALDRFLGVISG